MTFPRPPTTRWPAPPPPPQVCGWWATLPLYMADAVIAMTATAAARMAFPDVVAAAPAVIGLTAAAAARAVPTVTAAAPAVLPIKAVAVRMDAFTLLYPSAALYPSPTLYPVADPRRALT